MANASSDVDPSLRDDSPMCQLALTDLGGVGSSHEVTAGLVHESTSTFD
jgi:hypothetical protein